MGVVHVIVAKKVAEDQREREKKRREREDREEMAEEKES